MKTLVIINGVTGAIGSACLARFCRDRDATIIGLSRQARNIDAFCVDGILPDSTLICSIGDISSKADCEKFAMKIDKTVYEKIVYIHAVGVYPFEIDRSVSNDFDGDGIDDRVMRLSHDAFFAMTNSLEKLGLPMSALIFGSIADKFKPIVHTSWWMVMGNVKERMKLEVVGNSSTAFSVLNISSVICPHELITRPFVFQNTNADARFWLMPEEVAQRVYAITESTRTGFAEEELFHPADYYEVDHFTEEKFVARKRAELGI